ncbi:MAG: phosphoribosylglycinamide formyltransferase [Sinobacteraceae bacterium]|nr:phosphoribosylglycinamide formyltransferase [Nevskiaceae bacterium]
MSSSGGNRPRLAVLVSGRGRNLQALQAACADGRIEADLVRVISNQPDAPALQLARDAGIDALALPHRDFDSRADFDTALGAALREARPDIVALAGFMRILGAELVAEFQNRMLNIHPSLLPKYPGLETHQRAVQAADDEHGATVHFVNGDLDGGPCVIQGKLKTRPGEDVQSLASRVLQDIELKIYPQAVAWMARGELTCARGQAMFKGRPLPAPLSLEDLEASFR